MRIGAKHIFGEPVRGAPEREIEAPPMASLVRRGVGVDDHEGVPPSSAALPPPPLPLVTQHVGVIVSEG